MRVENVRQARSIAVKFLEQYNSTITFRSATLEDEVWIVVFDIGLTNKQIRNVQINRSTGNILGYTTKS